MEEDKICENVLSEDTIELLCSEIDPLEGTSSQYMSFTSQESIDLCSMTTALTQRDNLEGAIGHNVAPRNDRTYPVNVTETDPKEEERRKLLRLSCEKFQKDSSNTESGSATTSDDEDSDSTLVCVDYEGATAEWERNLAMRESVLEQEIEDLRVEVEIGDIRKELIDIAESTVNMEPTVFTSQDILKKSVCTPDTIKPERGASSTSTANTIDLDDIDIDSSDNGDHNQWSIFDTLKNYLFIKSDIRTEWHKSSDVKHNIPYKCNLCPRLFYSERNCILHAYAHTLNDTIGVESRYAISSTSGVTTDATPSTSGATTDATPSPSGATRDATPSTSGVNAEFCTTTNTMDDPIVPSDEESQEPEMFTPVTNFRPLNDKNRTSRLSTFNIRTKLIPESDSE